MPDGSATTTERALLDRGVPDHRSGGDPGHQSRQRSLDAATLRRQFLDTRSCTERLAEPLSAEDAAAQSMPAGMDRIRPLPVTETVSVDGGVVESNRAWQVID